MTYPCDICGKQFQNPKNLEMHVRTFNVTSDTCPICGTGFGSKRLLQTHMTAAHVPQISNTYSFHCVFCNQGFFKKHDLRPHILHLHSQRMLNTLTRNSNMSQEKSNETFTTAPICNICNLVFETHDHYVEHRMYYYKNHTFSCKFCAQNFQGMYMLHHHNKLVHYSEDKRKSYSYICDICNEGFNHESHFYSHNIHVHSNEVNLAEKEERSRLDHLTGTLEHVRNIFTKQKQNKQPSNEYTCQICQLKCIDMNQMAKHIEFYANDGDFKCDKCKRRCRTFLLLDQHKKLTHYCRDIYNGHMCHICGEILETVIALRCHEKHSHSGITGKNTNNEKNCTQISSSNVTQKITENLCESKNDISNVTEYNCVFCNMKFSTASSVQTHIVHVHMDDMIAKRAALKLALPITDNDNIQKQLIETTQALSSSSSVSSSSKDKSIQPIQTTQQSNNIASNIMARADINDRTTKKLKKLKIIRLKKDKITEKTLIPCSNKSNQDNISSLSTVASNTTSKTTTSVHPSGSTGSTGLTTTFKIIAPKPKSLFGNNSSVPLVTGSTILKNVTNIKSKNNMESTTNTSVSSSGSTTSKTAAPSAEFGNNNSVPVSIESTMFKTVVPNPPSKDNTSTPLSGSTNNFRKTYGVSSSKARSINEFKPNSVSTLNRSVINENQSKTTSVCVLPTVPLSTLQGVIQSWKSSEITKNSELGNSYNYNYYSCPLCPLQYPSLMYFHAHLQYAHADSIRTDKLNIPQINQTQRVSMIECLLCPCIFIDEITYRKHLRNSHMYFVYITNSEMAKFNNVCNPPVTQASINRKSTIPETITVDDDDDNVKNTLNQQTIEVTDTLDHKGQNDNVKNTPNQQTTEVTDTLDHRGQNDKIGKLRVKPFAKIIENLSKDSALELL